MHQIIENILMNILNERFFSKKKFLYYSYRKMIRCPYILLCLINEIISIYFKLNFEKSLGKLLLLVRSMKYEKIVLIWLFIWRINFSLFIHWIPQPISTNTLDILYFFIWQKMSFYIDHFFVEKSEVQVLPFQQTHHSERPNPVQWRHISQVWS